MLLGDRLCTAQGTDATVAGVRHDVGRSVVYTLTVAKDHTFFVGNARVLVHNSTACDAVYNSLVDGQRLPVNEALQKAIDYLGPNPVEDLRTPGRFVSADGKGVVRLTDSDILGLHGGGPHINFAYLVANLNPRKLGRVIGIGNKHIYLI